MKIKNENSIERSIRLLEENSSYDKFDNLGNLDILKGGISKDNYNLVFDTPSKGKPFKCIDCPNHPSNGGSGICNCTIGIIKFR